MGSAFFFKEMFHIIWSSLFYICFKHVQIDTQSLIHTYTHTHTHTHTHSVFMPSLLSHLSLYADPLKPPIQKTLIKRNTTLSYIYQFILYVNEYLCLVSQAWKWAQPHLRHIYRDRHTKRHTLPWADWPWKTMLGSIPLDLKFFKATINVAVNHILKIWISNSMLQRW